MHKIVAPTFMTEVLARACSSALVLLFAPFVAGGLGCTKYMNKASDSASDAEVASDTFPAAKLATLRPAVTEFCSACHAMPRPSSSAKSDWEMEVVQGFFSLRTKRSDSMDVPDEADTLRFFTSLAPESLSMPRDVVGISEATCFEPAYPAGFPDKLPPGITHLKPIELGNESQAAVLYADVSSGTVRAWWPNRPGKPTDHLATFLQPVHLETCDIDGDGLTDVVAADIGEFNASDTDLGRVMLARQVPVDQDSSQRSDDLPKFEKHVILDGLSRVSDVRPGDFNGDGRIDLIVAVFGWRKTGEILLLENVGMQDNGIPSFRPRVIDNRHGAVNTLPVDFNGDGHLDFIALISQEHEVIVAFKNDGKGSFQKKPRFGPRPILPMGPVASS